MQVSIPVDLFNPGEVFASLGFLEAADALLGDAEGGFDWRNDADVRFVLRANGDEDPFATVLEFLAEALVFRCAPLDYADAPPKRKATKKNAPLEDEEQPITAQDLRLSESFPDRQGDRMALPIQIEAPGARPIDLGHWADGSSRNDFKLYAGNRSAYDIALAMLRGTRKKPGNKGIAGDPHTLGIDALWDQRRAELAARPFKVLTPMKGRFNFDARGAWTALDAGYSPDAHEHRIAASPVVEILAAWGLEHARPDEYERRQVRYGAWGELAPPVLARPALAGASVSLPVRTFRFPLALSGKNKIVTFAEEESSR